MNPSIGSPPNSHAAHGYSYEAVEQPPLGYLPYLLTTQANAASEDALVQARLGGFIWSIVGAGLLVWVGWLCRLSLLELCVVLSICLLSPVAVHAASTVTDDSSAIAAGALVLATVLVALRRGRALAFAGLVVGLLVGAMKGIDFVVPFTILVALVLEDVTRRRRPTRTDIWRRYGCVACLFIGSVISYAGWIVFQDVGSPVPPQVVLHALLSFSSTSYPRLSTILSGMQLGISDLISYVPAPLYWLWNLSVYGTLAGVVLLRDSAVAPRLRSLAAAIFIGVLALAAAYPTVNAFVGHFDWGSAERYTLPLLPLVGIVVARTLRPWGLLVVGIALPGLAVIVQLVNGQT